MIVSSVQAAYFLGVRHDYLKSQCLEREYRRQQNGAAARFAITYRPGAGRGHGYQVELEALNTAYQFIHSSALEALIADYRRRFGLRVTTVNLASWASVRRGACLNEIRRGGLNPTEQRIRLAPAPWEGIITMGADPEFELQLNGEHISASRYFSGGGQVGTDGASSTGEIRPRPGTPEQVYENVRACLTRVARRLNGERHRITVHGGAGVHVPLGGHIHFGGPGIPQDRVRSTLQDLWISERLNAYCSPRSVRQRSSAGYGRMGNVRDQPHGWEYRAPCSWLAHPVLTRGALLIAFLIAQPQEAPVINRWEDILELTDDEDRKAAIREFYTFRSGAIEQQDLLEAWGLRDNLPEEESVQNRTYPVEAGTGTNVREIVEGLSASRTIRVVGFAPNAYSRNESSIYYDRDLHLSRFGCMPGVGDLQRWEGNGTGYNIYLSRTLRNDIPLARQTLERLFATIASYDAVEEGAYA